MNSKKTENFFINICTIIFMAFFSVFVIVNALCSLFQTAYMELYLDTEKPLYKADSPLLLIILTIVFLVICILFFKKKELTHEMCVSLEKITLIWTAIICFIIIFIFRVRIACDSAAVSEIAIQFLEGDFSAFSGDGYLVHYPHQLGWISFLMIGYYIFGKDNYIVFQCINVMAILCTVYYFHRISDILFHDLKIKMFTSVLSIGMLPLFLFSTFIYGDVPGLGLAVISVYYVLCYLDNGKKRYILPAILSMALSIMLKSNNLIVLIAVCMVLLLNFIRTKDKYALLFVIGIVLGVKIMNVGIDSCFMHMAGINEMPDGIPKIAWIAMGLQSNEYLENGWYNSYNWNIYNQNDLDTAKTTAVCIADIKASLQSFVEAPISSIRFFFKSLFRSGMTRLLIPR